MAQKVQVGIYARSLETYRVRHLSLNYIVDACMNIGDRVICETIHGNLVGVVEQITDKNATRLPTNKRIWLASDPEAPTNVNNDGLKPDGKSNKKNKKSKEDKGMKVNALVLDAMKKMSKVVIVRRSNRQDMKEVIIIPAAFADMQQGVPMVYRSMRPGCMTTDNVEFGYHVGFVASEVMELTAENYQHITGTFAGYAAIDYCLTMDAKVREIDAVVYKLEARKREIEQMQIYKMLADTDPDAKNLLDSLNTIVGEGGAN